MRPFMRPFNLEEYLKNPSKKMVTRSGYNARIICTDRKDADYPIIALVSRESIEKESTLYYTKEGRFYVNGLSESDLFFVTERREGWVNVFKGADGNSCVGDSHIFKSEEDAEKEGKTDKSYIGTTKIEWEE